MVRLLWFRRLRRTLDEGALWFNRPVRPYHSRIDRHARIAFEFEGHRVSHVSFLGCLMHNEVSTIAKLIKHWVPFENIQFRIMPSPVSRVFWSQLGPEMVEHRAAI